jgi:hypothetical protein
MALRFVYLAFCATLRLFARRRDESRLLGHTNPAFTASTYAHMFEQARHADELRERMADGYGRLLDVNAMSTSARNQPQPVGPKVAAISGIRG